MAVTTIQGAPGTSKVKPEIDVIKPNKPWVGAYASGNALLPSPLAVRNRPWELPEDIRWMMLRDSQVFAGYMLWKTAVLVDGIQVYPSSNTKDSNGKPSKTREKIAVMLAEALLWNLNNVRGGLHVKLLQLLDCCVWGYKAASQVYREQKIGRWKGKLVLDRLRVMANEDYNIRTNQFGDVVGLQPANESGDDNIYAIRKFLYACFRPYNDHPLGTDILWPAYEPFYNKKMMAPERLANATQFGSPSFWTAAPENVETVKILDQFGQPVKRPAQLPNGEPDPLAGQAYEIPINMHLLAGLKGFEGNGSAIVLPYGSELHTIEPKGKGETFKFINDDSDLAIIKSMFFTSTWTEQEKNGSKAKNQQGASISMCSLMDGKKMLSDIIEEYVAENIIAFNEWDGISGEELLDLVPEVTFGNIEAGALSSIFNSIAALWSTGFFDDSQRADICRKLALPMPDPNQKPRNEKQPTGNVLVNNKDSNNKDNADNQDDQQDD